METTKPNNPPAFPAMDMNNRLGIDRLELRYEGMTLRDYFAAKAMSQLIAQSKDDLTFGEKLRNKIAEASYLIADAMLKERSKF